MLARLVEEANIAVNSGLAASVRKGLSAAGLELRLCLTQKA